MGTHSFHNYASTKGRQLKEVRKRVKASIDLKKSGGKPAPGPENAAGGAGSASAPGSEEDAAAAAAGGGDAGESGSKKRRWVSKDEWRTYRYKKKSAADQKTDDAWFGKQSVAGVAPEESVETAAEPPVVAVAGAEQQAVGDEGPESALPRSVEEGTSGDAVGSADAGSEAAVAAVATPKDVAGAGGAACAEGVVVKSDGGGGEVGGDAATAVSAPGAEEAAGVGGEDEGPEKQILLRELRTRCSPFSSVGAALLLLLFQRGVQSFYI